MTVAVNYMTRSKDKGQSFIEVAVGLMILIPIVFILFDLSIIVLAVQVNDSTCREAARVAASGIPDQIDAQPRVQAIIDRANSSGSSMIQPWSIGGTTISFNLITTPIPPVGGGPVQGTVTVQTTVTVTPFLVPWLSNNPLTFTSQQSFPITYVYPNI